MTVQLAAVTFDCHDALALGTFWSQALGRPLDDGASTEFAAIGMAAHDGSEPPPRDIDRLTWMFASVPEGKQAKNRCHVDLTAPDREAEVQRLTGLGATKIGEGSIWGFSWTVMQDPEGNEFCVAGQH